MTIEIARPRCSAGTIIAATPFAAATSNRATRSSPGASSTITGRTFSSPPASRCRGRRGRRRRRHARRADRARTGPRRSRDDQPRHHLERHRRSRRHGVRPHGRHQRHPRRQSLQCLRAPDFAAVAGDGCIVRHVLRLERHNAQATIGEGARQSRDDQRFADVGPRALNHQRAAHEARKRITASASWTTGASPCGGRAIITTGRPSSRAAAIFA